MHRERKCVHKLFSKYRWIIVARTSWMPTTCLVRTKLSNFLPHQKRKTVLIVSFISLTCLICLLQKYDIYICLLFCDMQNLYLVFEVHANLFICASIISTSYFICQSFEGAERWVVVKQQKISSYRCSNLSKEQVISTHPNISDNFFLNFMHM